jgi:hypothetical protein
MPFTTTILKAFDTSTQVTIDGYELDGGGDQNWSYEGPDFIRIELPDSVAFLSARQELDISDEGGATVIDTDGESHEITFERLRPLCAADVA